MGLHISAARSRLHGAPSRLPPLLNSPLHPPAARPHGARTLSLHPPVPRAAYRMTLVFRRSDGGRGRGEGPGEDPRSGGSGGPSRLVTASCRRRSLPASLAARHVTTFVPPLLTWRPRSPLFRRMPCPFRRPPLAPSWPSTGVQKDTY